MIPFWVRPRSTRLLTPFLLGSLALMGASAQATTYKVTTLSSDGPGSIGEAIGNINQGNGTSPYLINFAPNVRGSIKLENGVLGVGDTVTINGPGSDKLTIDGQNKDGVFAFGGQITLKNLTIANGTINPAVGVGGGIQNYGFLTIENCVIRDNFAAQGGGIYNRGTVILRNSEVYDCNSNEGGGLYNSTYKSRAVVRNSLFFSNGTQSDTSTGGAIHNQGSLTLTDTSIVNSEADMGAGIYTVFVPEGPDFFGGDVTMEACLFDSNRAENYGGAFFNGSGTFSEVYDTDFQNNSTSGGDDTRGGGAIDNAGSLFMSYVNLRDNEANSGGAIYNSGFLSYSYGDINGNEAFSSLSRGGGIYSLEGSLEVDHVNFLNNVARARLSESPEGNGGAIFGQNLKLSDCAFLTNSAAEGGGAIAGLGMNLTRCQIIFNTSDGAIAFPTRGGGILNFLDGPEDPTSNISQCNIQYNTADLGGGLFNQGKLSLTSTNLIGNEGIEAGGGIYNLDLSTANETAPPAVLTVSRCAFVSNLATTASALYNDCLVFDGATPLFKGIARVSNTTFDGNQTSFGGTILNTSSLVLHSSTLTNNTAESFLSPSGIDNELVEGGGTGKIVIGNTIVKAEGEGEEVDNLNFAGFDGDMVVSEGYNISSDSSGPSTSTDRLNTNPKLGDLTYNGGFTLNRTPLLGSPAINTGNPAATGEGQTDQRGRGFARVRAGRLDVGAIEVQNDAPSVLSITGPNGRTAKFENGVVSNPLRGQSSQDEFVTFTTLVTDPDGPRDITSVEFILGEKISELRLTYNAENGKFSVRDAAGKSVSAAAGTNTILTVETGALDVAGSKASRANGGLQVKWRLKITSFRDVVQRLRLQGRDVSGGRSNAPSFGTWTFVLPSGQVAKASGGSS